MMSFHERQNKNSLRNSHENISPRGGGALPLEGGIGLCHGHDLLFSGHSALPSQPNFHQCSAHMPRIFNSQKNFAFSALFLTKISALKMQNFHIFLLPTPHNFQGKPTPKTLLFGTLCSIYLPTKNLSSPPPRY